MVGEGEAGAASFEVEPSAEVVESVHDAPDAVSSPVTVRALRVAPGAKKLGQWRRVTLSERDWEILSWASEQKFLTFEQVSRWYPDGPANPLRPPSETPSKDTLRKRRRPGNWYLQERLRKLVRFDILKRVPVYTEASGALQPGQVGFDLLEGMSRSHGVPKPEGIDWKNYLHDKAATDVRWVLEKRLGGQHWKSERVLRVQFASRMVPDAMVEVNGRSMAVEVELTRKSTARYLAIFQRYLEWKSPRLDAVLYVVPNSTELSHLFLGVLPAVLAKTELWGIRKPDLSLFRFTSLARLAEGRFWWTVSTPAHFTEGRL
jgi:hypothetical protein